MAHFTSARHIRKHSVFVKSKNNALEHYSLLKDALRRRNLAFDIKPHLDELSSLHPDWHRDALARSHDFVLEQTPRAIREGNRLQYIAYLTRIANSDVLGCIRKYQRKEITSLLELALWKFVVCRGPFFRSTEEVREQHKKKSDENFEAAGFLEQQRYMTGASVVIGHVVSFLRTAPPTTLGELYYSDYKFKRDLWVF